MIFLALIFEALTICTMTSFTMPARFCLSCGLWLCPCLFGPWHHLSSRHFDFSSRQGSSTSDAILHTAARMIFLNTKWALSLSILCCYVQYLRLGDQCRRFFSSQFWQSSLCSVATKGHVLHLDVVGRWKVAWEDHVAGKEKTWELNLLSRVHFFS